MADLTCEYALSSGAGTVVFNEGELGDGTDKYWLSSINGLDGPVIRAPVDLVPFGDGGLIQTFRLGPRRVVFDGMLLIESSRSQADCQAIRNQMISDLEAVLESMLTDAGILDWQPAGQGDLSLTSFYEVGLSVNYSDNYAVANFSFGLVSPDAYPAD